MANGYMPRADFAAQTWMRCFANAIANNPGLYHVSAEQVTRVNDAVNAFIEVMKEIRSPATKSRSTVVRKDTLRADAEAAIRPVYMQIKLDTDISSADKILAAVRPIKTTRSRIGKPDSRPRLSLTDLGQGVQLLKYKDAESSFRIAKPKGAIGLQVVRYIGDSRPTSINQLQYYQTYTRQGNKIQYFSPDDLKLVTYMARWINRKGETGPWGNPVTMRITSTVMPIGRSLAA